MQRGVWPIARRALLLWCAWIVLGRTGPVDLAVGAVVAVVVAIASDALAPPRDSAVSAGGILRFALRFVARSLIAGVDVAGRVLGPRVRVRPGIASVPCAVPAGVPRQFFSSLSSLQPGILPLGGDASSMQVHSLDIEAPVEPAIAGDAAAFLAMYRTRAQ
jgi:multicomponent Na+:H+ antiporter subunit E